MQQPEGVEPVLVIVAALITNDRLDFEVLRLCQGDPVLGDIGLVLGRIGFIVATKNERSRGLTFVLSTGRLSAADGADDAGHSATSRGDQ